MACYFSLSYLDTSSSCDLGKLATEYNQAEKDFLAGRRLQEIEAWCRCPLTQFVDGDVEYGSVSQTDKLQALFVKKENMCRNLEDHTQVLPGD